MRTIKLSLFLFLTFKTLVAMNNDAPVPGDNNKENKLVKKETKFEALIAKIHEGTRDFELQLGTVKGTNVPVILIDGNEFVILDGNINANSLHLDFKGMNIVLLADITTNQNINIACENIIIFGNMHSIDGNISIRANNNFFAFGAKIKAKENIDIIAQSGVVVMDFMFTSAKLYLYNNIRNALSCKDLHQLGLITVQMLKSAIPNKIKL